VLVDRLPDRLGLDGAGVRKQQDGNKK